MILSSIRAIVLDAVGTLIHPDPPAPEVYARVGKRWGSRHDAAAIKTRFIQAFAQEEQTDRRLGWRTSEEREMERWQHIVARVLDDVSDEQACFQTLFEHFSRPEAWRCAPETGQVLSGLAQQGFLLGMASNYDSRLHRVIAGKAELRRIQHVIISAEVGWRKPAAEFFATVCRTVGLPADQILYVGDDLTNDVQGAQSAGVHAVWFNPVGSEDPSGNFYISRLSELEERLPGLNPRA
jgi:putative hydrolase of the HAD superfamily